MLLPALNKARAKAYESSCAARQKQISLALAVYADDFRGYLPEAYSLNYPNQFKGNDAAKYHFGALVAYRYLPGSLMDFRILNCPAKSPRENTWQTTYCWFTGSTARATSVTRLPADLKKGQKCFFGDLLGSKIGTFEGAFAVSDNHLGGRANWARSDGSVVMLHKSAMKGRTKLTATFITPEEVTL